MRARTVLAWSSAVPFACWAIVRVFGLDGFYPGVQLISFTPYVAAAAPVGLLVTIALRNWQAAEVAGFSAILLAICVVPRWVADDDAGRVTEPGPSVRFLSANLLAGGADLDRLVAIVRDQRVDVLALQEFTPESETGLDRAGLAELLPYRAAYPIEGVIGSAIYARHPLRNDGFRENPGRFGQARATVSIPGAPPIAVESVHPCAPYAQEVTGLMLEGLAGQPRATVDGDLRVLVGDFNSTLDHDALRELLDSGYRDAASTVGKGLTPTWPYYGPRSKVTPKVALDHVFADARIGIRSVDFFRLPRADHRAVLAELVLPTTTAPIAG